MTDIVPLVASGRKLAQELGRDANERIDKYKVARIVGGGAVEGGEAEAVTVELARELMLSSLGEFETEKGPFGDALMEVAVPVPVPADATVSRRSPAAPRAVV